MSRDLTSLEFIAPPPSQPFLNGRKLRSPGTGIKDFTKYNKYNFIPTCLVFNQRLKFDLKNLLEIKVCNNK
jgi:hypothetical protein